MLLSKVQMCSQTQYEDKNVSIHLWNWKKISHVSLLFSPLPPLLD